MTTCPSNDRGASAPTPCLGGYAWRRDRGLLTIGDRMRRYRFTRWPRGAYRAPLPEDRIICGREVAA